MSGIEEIPSTSRIRGYDYANTTWRSIAVNLSGEIGLRRGETLTTRGAMLVTANSGGITLGSGLNTSGYVVDRVKISVPRQACSGGLANWGYSGEGLAGIYIGGKSNFAPFPGSGCITSSYGYWLATGERETLYVQQLDEIYVCTEHLTSGLPITWLAEVIAQ